MVFRKSIIGFSLAAVLLTALIVVSLLKTTVGPVASDVYSIIQTVTGVLSAIIAVIAIAFEIYDRCKRREANKDDAEQRLLCETEMGEQVSANIQFYNSQDS
jgi:hypothetical protein